MSFEEEQYHPPSLVIMGEISATQRSVGDHTSSSDTINTMGPNRQIPQLSIGIMPYRTFKSQLGRQTNEANSDDQLTPWNSVGAVSLDGLFVPYTNAASAPFLPHFEDPEEEYAEEIGTSKTLDPFNPFDLLTVEGTSYAADEWMERGHSIAMALHSNPLDPDFQERYSGADAGEEPLSFNFQHDYWYRGKAETDGIKSIALRSPLVLSGWGYDLDGNAVPADPDEGTVHNEAAWNANLWKTGPVDLRWDDNRKVWAASSQLKISDVSGVCQDSYIDIYGDDTGLPEFHVPLVPKLITFGTGLTVAEGHPDSGQYIINQIPLHMVSGQGAAVGGERADVPFHISSGLVFRGSGVDIVDEGCITVVNIPAGSGSGVKVIDTAFECDPASLVTTYTDASKLNFGSGLYVVGLGGSLNEGPEFTIHTIPQIHLASGWSLFQRSLPLDENPPVNEVQLH